jgi:putative tRNA adenosine deaminase-associated protein
VVESFEKWAVVIFPQDGVWEVGELPPTVAEDLEAVIAAVRGQQPGAFVVVNVADEFFVVVRNRGGNLHFLLSDVTASVAWDLAAQVMEQLDLELPADDELEDVWPAGDLGVFDDLGLDEMELGAILSDDDAYADEMLSTLARRLGFAEAYEQVLDALV